MDTPFTFAAGHALWNGEAMTLKEDQYDRLRRFVQTRKLQEGLLALDLDGTALLEDRGKIFISSSVEKGVKAIHDLGRPVVINTLRFPLSVINTVGDAWYQIADVPILTVLLNGSILGYIKCKDSALIYEELAAFPLSSDELKTMLTGVRQLLNAGITDILLFYYSRDWQRGETLWTPDKNRVEALKTKYVSASTVYADSVDQLAENLGAAEICMLSLLVDRPEDTLMAYQHSRRNSFFTRRGVDKASGIREIAKVFNLSLADSFGAGDTQMDSFLSELGLAIIVGDSDLPFRGTIDTLRVPSPLELGEVIITVAKLMQAKPS